MINKVKIGDLFALYERGATNGKNGLAALLIVLLLVVLAQFFGPISTMLSIIFYFLSFLIIPFVLTVYTKEDCFYFFFFISQLNISLFFLNDKELSLFLPIAVIPFILLRINRDHLTVKLYFINSIITIYFLIILYIFFLNIKIPFVNISSGANSGLIGRIKLLNTLLIFIISFYFYDVSYLKSLTRYLKKFYMIILIIGVIMYISNIHSLPLFNTFSWSIIEESNNSKRMGILGSASIFVMILGLSYKSLKLGKFTWGLIIVGVILSGGRTTLLTFIFLLLSAWGLRKRVFHVIILINIFLIVGVITLNLTSAVTSLPGPLKRVFTILPSEYYDSSELGNSAASASSTWRLVMWIDALEKINESPLLGHGFSVPKGEYSFHEEGFSTFQKMNPMDLMNDFIAVGNLHNTYVSLIYVMGCIGLFSFSLILWKVFWKIYHGTKMADGEKKSNHVFFTLLFLESILSSITGDLYLSKVFFLYLAIIIKSVYFPSKHKQICND